MTLSCKHVDDIVIGAPFFITQDLINSLNIDFVVQIVDTEEDTVKKIFRDLDQFKEARDIGKLVEININDEFYNITTEKIS